MKKLDCSSAEEILVKEIDEGLTADERVLIESHLEQCASCRRYKATVENVIEAVTSAAHEDPGPEYWNRYFSTLDAKLREKQCERKWGPWWKICGATAVIVLALVCAQFGLRAGTSAPLSEGQKLAVAQELFNLYGPVSEAYPQSAPSDVDLQSLQSDPPTLPNDVALSWFEVEEEPLG